MPSSFFAGEANENGVIIPLCTRWETLTVNHECTLSAEKGDHLRFLKANGV